MTKKFLIMLVAAMAIILASCDDSEVSTVENNNEVEAEEPSENANNDEAAEDGPEFYKPDETVSIDGIEITLDEVSWGEEAEYSETENDKIVRIDVNIKNNSDDNAFVDETEFDLYDEEGNKLDTYFGNDDANMFGSEIKKGKQMSGVLEYDTPESGSYELYYEPSFSLKENNEVIWLIESDDLD